VSTNAPESRPVVLVVDSDDDTRDLYARAFARAAWRVDVAESAPIALAKAITARPDALIIVATRLLGMDGEELLRLLKTDVDTRTIPVIFITTDAPGRAAKARAAGAADVFAAPCAPDALVARALELVPPFSARRRASVDALRAADADLDRMIVRTYCPECSVPLSYVRAHATHVGRRTERWVVYECPTGCGRFEYRQRTRKLRKIS